MKYMITGAEPRGESDGLDPEELNRRVRHHQQALDELLRARVRDGKTGLIFVSVGSVRTARRSLSRIVAINVYKSTARSPKLGSW